MIRLARSQRLGFALLLLLTSTSRTQAQQKLTPVNYGNEPVEKPDFKSVPTGKTLITKRARHFLC